MTSEIGEKLMLLLPNFLNDKYRNLSHTYAILIAQKIKEKNLLYSEKCLDYLVQFIITSQSWKSLKSLTFYVSERPEHIVSQKTLNHIKENMAYLTDEILRYEIKE